MKEQGGASWGVCEPPPLHRRSNAAINTNGFPPAQPGTFSDSLTARDGERALLVRPLAAEVADFLGIPLR
jgi:hypothetical protein